MISKEKIIREFKLFSGNDEVEGLESWINPNTRTRVFKRLGDIEEKPLSKTQLNQLLVLAQEAPMSDDFFKYYWSSIPTHPYDVNSIQYFDKEWIGSKKIKDLKHLKWGLYRLYVDCLLYFGNIRGGYRFFRNKNKNQLEDFFFSKRYATKKMKSRGPPLDLEFIAKDKRYLISEMACKSYDIENKKQSTIEEFLINSWNEHQKRGGGRAKIHEILDGSSYKKQYPDKHQQVLFSTDDILDDIVSSEEDIKSNYSKIAEAFIQAHDKALKNTENYLSMASDLDVYVATSMRSREHFRQMSDFCETVFSDQRLKDLNLRYFDPTLSAAKGHEDKGLIECLMVNIAKVLVYTAGDKESFGKDAEAAMALSLGKPVIFYCDTETRKKFYKDVHPLSRLVHFDTGVAVGAMVTDKKSYVADLLYRIFENKMQYELVQSKPGYFKIKERLTGSVIRLQTNDELLRRTFWNHWEKKIQSKN